MNTLGDYTTVSLTTYDGLVIYASVTHNGRRQGVVYLRPSGFIDPIPEVNTSAEAVYF